MSVDYKTVKIGLAADHRGYQWKEILKLKDMIGDKFIEWEDVGTYDAYRTDYPIFVEKLIKLMAEGTVDRGVLLCGSGIGASIAANRHKGVYAGLCWNDLVAKKAKEDDNINILVLPADFLVHEVDMQSIVEAWFNAEFKEGRYKERLDMLENVKDYKIKS